MTSDRKYRDKVWLSQHVRSGKFPDEIADICDVTEETIQNWIKRLGIAPYREKEWLEQHISNHISEKAISEWCCVNKSTIKRWMRRHDIEHPGLAPEEVMSSFLTEKFEEPENKSKKERAIALKRIFAHRSTDSTIAAVLNTSRTYVNRVTSPGGIHRTRRSEPIPAGLREQVLTRDGNRCVRCRSQDGDDLSLHQIIPGDSTEDNLATLCHRCHLDAHGARAFSGPLAYESVEEFWEHWMNK